MNFPNLNDEIRVKIPVIKCPAEKTYDNLSNHIRIFASQADPEHQLELYLNSSNSTENFHIKWLGYLEPDLIKFEGVTDDLEKFQIIQHYSQINVSLVIVKKIKDKKNNFGFIVDEGLKDDKKEETMK